MPARFLEACRTGEFLLHKEAKISDKPAPRETPVAAVCRPVTRRFPKNPRRTVDSAGIFRITPYSIAVFWNEWQVRRFRNVKFRNRPKSSLFMQNELHTAVLPPVIQIGAGCQGASAAYTLGRQSGSVHAELYERCFHVFRPIF